jgi:hypothetical protein
MNNFLNLQLDEDYTTRNKPYHVGTWEPIAAAPRYLIPFQFAADSTDTPTIYTVDDAGATTNITALFGGTLTLTAASDYWEYDGGQLSNTLNDIFTLRVVDGGNTYYSDYIDSCGFDGKLKYKVSSVEDFGGMKYDEGYEQWIYKDAVVTRSPRADIEVTGDTLNGEVKKEKIVTAVRYVLRMRVTELEYEAFVHSIGADVEVTDRNGKVYDCQSLEIDDPTWHRSNGILEISFVDGNNINIWSKNNSSL